MDRFDRLLQAISILFILFMMTSLIYLYVLVGYSWNLTFEFLFDSRVLGAVWTSISSASIVSILALCASIPTAYILTYKEFKGKELVETLLIELPQTFPPATVGLVYLIMLGPGSPVNIAFTYFAVLVAKFYVSAPFALSFTLRRFREIRRTGLDMIARTLKGRTRHILTWILLPLSTKDLIAGSTLTWARAMGEVAATLIFAGAIPWKTEIIPTLVYLTSKSTPQMAIAASFIAATLSIIALLSFKLLVGRKK